MWKVFDWFCEEASYGWTYDCSDGPYKRHDCECFRCKEAKLAEVMKRAKPFNDLPTSLLTFMLGVRDELADHGLADISNTISMNVRRICRYLDNCDITVE